MATLEQSPKQPASAAPEPAQRHDETIEQQPEPANLAAAGSRVEAPPAPAAGRRPSHDLRGLQRTLGNQAVARMLRSQAGRPAHTPAVRPLQRSASGTIQREESWTRYKDDALDTFVTNLDKLVNASAKAIIANPLGVPASDGYLKRWLGLVASFAKTWQDSGGLIENALAAEPFIYTSFGYAVESLTSLQIKSALGGDLPKGHTIALQATRGHTRPDIVVKDEEGQDSGWFDITASRSETHIDGKTGSGWSTRAYVAEVTYPSLSGEDLLTICKNVAGASISSEELEKLSKLAAANKALRDKQYTKAAGLVRLALQSVDHLSNMSKRQQLFEETLGVLMANDDNAPKLSPAAAKGLIAEVWPLISTSYAKLAAEAGYKGAKAQGARSEPARELIYELAVE